MERKKEETSVLESGHHLRVDLADVVGQLVVLLQQTLGLGHAARQLVARTLGLPLADLAQVLHKNNAVRLELPGLSK